MKKIFFTLVIMALFSCDTETKSSKKDTKNLKIDYEKITLDNGLDVVFHVDKSDPVVAVELMVHVGSAREIENRTGFAHLFEHLLFLESENLGKGGLDKMSARIGGSGANGSTSRDRTNYLQTVPSDALEKMIWAEADKLGWFINTVTEPVLAKEKQVVKNEKRQSIDNRPYGHKQYVIDKNLYPKDHPYNWQVIGSLEDLQNATVNDVKTFFKKWYVPNNATLVLTGDINVAEAKKWVHKYFDEIPRGEDIAPIQKRPGVITENKLLVYEDNFARLPELTLTWPVVEQYHKDAYALDILTEYLSTGKNAHLNKILVDDLKLTASTSMYNYTSELAGQVQLVVRAFNEVKLDDVKKGIDQAFTDFETNGIPQKDLNRIKAGLETDFYRSLSSVLGKGSRLASYNTYTGDPGYATKELNQALAVTAEDVMAVYNKYIKAKNFIATSFVPKNQQNLALTNSVEAIIKEEQIIAGSEEDFDASIAATYEKTPSSFDRSVEPPYGKKPEIKIPEIWKTSLDNGLQLYGTTNSEVPLVEFNIVIEGGQLLEKMDKLGVANLTANMLEKGTANKTVSELEDAIAQLGASIYVYATKRNIVVSATTLSKNYNKTIDLVTEMLLQPRWDEKEFELIKKSAITRLRQQEASPRAIASNAYNQLIYGDDVRAKNILGSVSSVTNITIDDLKTYYQNYISPSISKMHVVGDISKDKVTASLTSLNKEWNAKEVTIPNFKAIKQPEKSTVYFYDIPNAKQSQLRFGTPAMSFNSPDFYPANVMNYILGGGGFASQLTQQLREGKGYTYGIRSRFSGNKTDGTFTISSGVRSNITLEASTLVKQILENYAKNYNEKDLATTKGFLIKSNARAFETMRAKLNMLENISSYNLNADYVKDREKIVSEMTIPRIQELANKYVDPNKMIWLVVGDAETQLKRMKDLGFGEPVLLNKTQIKVKQ
ncbi:M16 family metallopeptidase [Tenacibaculum sp. M341]|uniref:M16 family metallopeptidase n=1 Tax=Tenacibaculum sp. M341 TaxID=2530339 RepID=UPI0010454677|nr:pitrilysin family protein [Tenacibaculum sp. M341]TCI91446.1 insulinase family protein [Tenacibaculum sp. M341]